MKKYIQISIRTKVETREWHFGSQFLDSFADDPKLAPEYISHNADKVHEPFLSKTDCKDVWADKAVIRAGGSAFDFYQDFAWRRKSAIKCTGCVSHKLTNNRGQLVPGSISLNADWNKSCEWYELYRQWCDLSTPQLGMLHLFTDSELDQSNKNKSFQVGSFKALLSPLISELGWAMFFGNEFAEKIEPGLIAAAGFPLEKIGSGYLVRVTEKITDVLNDYAFFAKRRSELKLMLDSKMFLSEEL